MITRTLDGTFLTSVANHPDVRPYIGPGDEALDLTQIISNPSNIALEAEGGGWVLVNLLPGVYELHTLFLPEARGKAYFRAAREALRWLFTTTDCLEVLTRCPDDNPGARMAASMVGFRERFRRDGAWAEGVGVSYQALTFDDWVSRDPQVAHEGHDFHVLLENEKALRGSELPDHPEDEAHDRMVGAALLMAKAGKTGKAVGLFNRWACFAGYAPIQMLSPTIADIADAILEVKDGQLRVLGVR